MLRLFIYKLRAFWRWQTLKRFATAKCTQFVLEVYNQSIIKIFFAVGGVQALSNPTLWACTLGLLRSIFFYSLRS